MRPLHAASFGLLALLGFAPSAPPPIAFNDNLVPAGALKNGALELSLVAQVGEWHPLGDEEAGTSILTFGEAAKKLTAPGPLVRVMLGTVIHVRVRNLSDKRVVVHGFSRRHVAVMDTMILAAGASGEARFVADEPGTFYYWGSTHGEDVNDRILEDAHLNGALVVDPPSPQPKDRIFVIERWVPDTTPDGRPDFPRELMTLNGRPWPYTERLTFDVGDSVHWRMINVSGDDHPFHLHGFYYQVNARGDFARDTAYWPEERRLVVTELLTPGTTMSMAWSPTRPGGWIFHCHFPPHVWPNGGIPPDTEPRKTRVQHVLNGYPGGDGMDHDRHGMGGLILGVYVRPPDGWRPAPVGNRRTLRLVVASDSQAGDSVRRMGYVMGGGAIGRYGPPLVLKRGEPTRIWVVNQMKEGTQVHWHGIELESPYDGVTGMSGTGDQRAHMIAPGDSSLVLLTPPRAGTFIYHTHLNDVHQLMRGLYGALVVLDSGQAWNPDSDLVFIAADDGHEASILNGGRTADTVTLHTHVPYRVRLINIAVFDATLRFQLTYKNAPVDWVTLAKDGANLPPWQRKDTEARQSLSVGETYDVQIQSPDSGTVALELRTLSGELRGQQVIHFRP